MTKQQEFFPKSSKNLLTSDEVFNALAEVLAKEHGPNIKIYHKPITVYVKNFYDDEVEPIIYDKFIIVKAGRRFWVASIGRQSEKADGRTVANLVAIPVSSTEEHDIIVTLAKFENSVDISDKIVLSLLVPGVIDLNTEGDYGRDEDIDFFIGNECLFIRYETNFENIDDNSGFSKRRYLPNSVDFYAKFCIKILKRSNHRH